MRLLLIRHGESEADILDVHEGCADFELTERGHRQATWSAIIWPSTISTPLYLHSSRIISCKSALYCLYIAFLLYFGMNTIWYLHIHLVVCKRKFLVLNYSFGLPYICSFLGQ